MINYKRQILIAVIFLVTAFQCLGQVEGLRRDVAFLADSVWSRYPGSEGDFRVRKHIAGRFSDCGLEYSEQTFDIVDRIWGEGSLRLFSGDTVTDFTQGNDFIVRGRSASDSLSAEYVVVLDSLPDTSLGLLRGKVAVCLSRGIKGRTKNCSDAVRLPNPRQVISRWRKLSTPGESIFFSLFSG